jgi:glycosyltransferase involved in cell wall biosynthesis
VTVKNILFVTHHRKLKTFARSAPWARELRARGYAVTLLCLANEARFRTRERDEGGVHYVETPDLLPGRLRSGWDPMSILHRHRYLRGKHFDLIHGFESRPATIYPIRRYLKQRRVPWLLDWNDWWGRGGLITEQRPGWYQRLLGGLETYYEEHFRTCPDATTVISRVLGARAERLGVPGRRIYWIPGGASTDVFVPVDPQTHRARFGLPKEAFIVGYAALDVTTDLPMVLEAVRQALSAIPRLLLVVTGRPAPDFAARVAQAGLEGHVRHFGVVDYKQLPHVLSCAEVFLLPLADTISNRGRWPHKVGDYLASGRATLVNPVGEMDDLFRAHEVGLAVPISPAGFAEGMVRLYKDAPLRLRCGANARRVAETELSWARIVDRLLACYDRREQGEAPRLDPTVGCPTPSRAC